MSELIFLTVCLFSLKLGHLLSKHQGLPEARDGRVSDAGRSICHHVSMLSSSPPSSMKTLNNGGSGSQSDATPISSGVAGRISIAGKVGKPGMAMAASQAMAEAELKPSELNRIGLEVRVVGRFL